MSGKRKWKSLKKIKWFITTRLPFWLSIAAVVSSVIAGWNDYHIMPWVFIVTSILTILFYQKKDHKQVDIAYQVRLEECFDWIAAHYDIQSYIMDKELPEEVKDDICEFMQEQFEDVTCKRDNRFIELRKKHGML